MASVSGWGPGRRAGPGRKKDDPTERLREPPRQDRGQAPLPAHCDLAGGGAWMC